MGKHSRYISKQPKDIEKKCWLSLGDESYMITNITPKQSGRKTVYILTLADPGSNPEFEMRLTVPEGVALRVQEIE